MATAKIATLLIRTLAKPIAVQLKSQAAQHETFRNVCISLAQRMHRTEMALRANLLPHGATQKVRPLNDAKAVANGANAISEGFLFFVAATLILGETYRGSRKKAEQRDRTEDELGRLRELVDRLAARAGVDIQELEREGEGSAGGGGGGAVGQDEQGGAGAVDQDGRPIPLASPQLQRTDSSVTTTMTEEARSRQLQSAVEVLLKLAIKNGWIAGDEGLQLDGIIRGDVAGPSSSSASSPPSSSSSLSSSRSSSPPSVPSPSPTTSEPLSSSIIHQVALERTRALAREVRGEHQPSRPDTSGMEDGLLLGMTGGVPPQQQQQPSEQGVNNPSDLYDLLAKLNRETAQDGPASS